MRIIPALAILACSLAFAAEKPEGPFAYDLYQRLGVAKTASSDDIKRAFRKLRGKYHPDLGGNKEAFESLAHAYDVLGDPEKRELYDRYGLNLDEFGYIKSNWETQTGLKAPRTGNPDSSPQNSTSNSNYAARQSYDERQEKSMRYMDELHDYFQKRHDGLSTTTDADVKELLFNLFSPLKFDLEAMTKHPRFRETMKLLLADSVWKSSDSNPLLGAFVREEWFQYMLEFQEKELGTFLAKFDPSNPIVHELLYGLHRLSSKINKQREYLHSIGLVMASMLREDPYRGTRAGEKLLDNCDQLWTRLGHEYLGTVGRDKMTTQLLSLLNYPEWRNHRKLARIAKTPPASYLHEEVDEYDKLRENYPDIFPAPTKEELRSKANRIIDKLDNTFKCRIAGLVNCEDERTQKELIEAFKNTKAKDLEMMMTLSPYHFHDMFKLMLADTIWDKADSELFKSFLDGDWYRTLRTSKPQMLEAFLEKHKSNNSTVQEFLRSLDAKTSTKPATAAKAAAPAAETTPSKPSDCIQNEMFNFFDPFGLLKKR